MGKDDKDAKGLRRRSSDCASVKSTKTTASKQSFGGTSGQQQSLVAASFAKSSKSSTTAAGSKEKIKIRVCKCGACSVLSNVPGVEWFETEDVNGKQGVIVLPVGERCMKHGQVFLVAYSSCMDWVTFCKLMMDSPFF